MFDRCSAEQLIEQLDLTPHPEGGWYRETWRGPLSGEGERASGTAILFLLTAGERSHWHTVDAEEMWVWQGGDPLALTIAEADEGPVRTIRLGGNVSGGEMLQGLVPTNAWQSAEALSPEQAQYGYTLLSCIVVPGFEFAGFRLAEPGWEPGG